MSAIESSTVWNVQVETSAGTFVATFTADGLAELDFPNASHGGRRRQSAQNDSVPRQIAKWAQQTKLALEAILSGNDPKSLPPLDWSAATDFQKRVWSALRNIRSGGTRTYSQIADEIGSPRAARAVGAACGANPIPVLVPCHRVLAAGGGLGGFSGGLDWKLRLLREEGVAL